MSIKTMRVLSVNSKAYLEATPHPLSPAHTRPQMCRLMKRLSETELITMLVSLSYTNTVSQFLGTVDISSCRQTGSIQCVTVPYMCHAKYIN